MQRKPQKKSTKKPMSKSVRKKIADGLKHYYKKKALEEKRLKRKRSAASRKGGETRKKKAREREEQEVKRRKQAVCKVLFDGHAEDPPTEHFWSNVKELEGKSMNGKLARLPAHDGNVLVSFKVVDADVLHQPADEEELAEGEEFQQEWDSPLEPKEFWPVFFENAREFLPETKEKKSDNTKSLMVTKIEVCFVPGEVQAD